MQYPVRCKDCGFHTRAQALSKAWSVDKWAEFVDKFSASADKLALDHG